MYRGLTLWFQGSSTKWRGLTVLWQWLWTSLSGVTHCFQHEWFPVAVVFWCGPCLSRDESYWGLGKVWQVICSLSLVSPSPFPCSRIWSRWEAVLPRNTSTGSLEQHSATWTLRSISKLESSSFFKWKVLVTAGQVNFNFSVFKGQLSRFHYILWKLRIKVNKITL